VEHLPIDAIIPYANNPRGHDERQLAKLEELIRKLGFLVPILVDENGVIIAGHGRYEAAKRLGLTHVPVIRITHLTEKQIRAFRIADNRLAELSSWNDKRLASELKDLLFDLEDPEIIELTAFEIGEIDARLEVLQHSDECDPANNVELPEPGPAVSQPGDLWLLGSHRLINASATEAATYEQLPRAKGSRPNGATRPTMSPSRVMSLGLAR
jgi:ParB-like chromosome segregation protein Spo0J